MADSRSFVGANPLASISVCWVSFQLLFGTVMNVPEPCNSRVGSANSSEAGNPNFVKDGPIARMITLLGTLPVMIRPPIPALSPVSTRIREDRLSACAPEVGVEVGVALAGGVAVALAVAVVVGVGVGLGAVPGTQEFGRRMLVTAMSSR